MSDKSARRRLELLVQMRDLMRDGKISSQPELLDKDGRAVKVDALSGGSGTSVSRGAVVPPPDEAAKKSGAGTGADAGDGSSGKKKKKGKKARRTTRFRLHSRTRTTSSRRTRRAEGFLRFAVYARSTTCGDHEIHIPDTDVMMCKTFHRSSVVTLASSLGLLHLERARVEVEVVDPFLGEVSKKAQEGTGRSKTDPALVGDRNHARAIDDRARGQLE